MSWDEDKIGHIVSEIGQATLKLLMNSETITKEMLIDELERYRKEATNTLQKGALRDAAQIVRSIK